MESVAHPSIITEFFDAFPAVLGNRFWPRARRVGAFILLLAVARSIIADCSTVPSGSMVPTLIEGDHVLVNKLAYDLKLPFTTIHLLRWASPSRGDIIVCFSPTDGTRLVKRVIGLPGDRIELRNNTLYINGERASYQSASPANLGSTAVNDGLTHRLLIESDSPSSEQHLVMLSPGIPSRSSFAPILIPVGKYFVMGDNRDNSLDSRYFGLVDRDQIVGRVKLIVASLGDFCIPRKARWLRTID